MALSNPYDAPNASDDGIVKLEGIGKDRNPYQESQYQTLLKQYNDWKSSNTPAPVAAPDNSANEAKQTAMFNQQKGDITDFLGRYNTAVPQIIDSTSTKYNIPGQINTTNAINSRIKTLQGNTDNSGAGGYSSGQQVDAALNSRYLPQYSTAMTNLLNSEGVAQTEEAQLIQPYQTEGTMLNDRLAREATGFTAEQQRELDQYKAALESNTTLTKAQMDNAEALAAAKLNYQAMVDSAKAQNNKPFTVGAGTYVYDPTTGKAKLIS